MSTHSTAGAGSSGTSSPARTQARYRSGAAVVALRPAPLAAVQGTLALDLEPVREPPEVRRSVSGSVLALRRADASTPGVLPAHQGGEAVEGWAVRFAQAVVEIVGGDRPVSQLLRWTSREVYLDLERRAALVARAGGHQPGLARVQPLRPRVQSLHSCVPTTDVVEVSSHVRYGERSRALAARFEHRRDRWICTALEFA